MTQMVVEDYMLPEFVQQIKDLIHRGWYVKFTYQKDDCYYVAIMERH